MPVYIHNVLSSHRSYCNFFMVLYDLGATAHNALVRAKQFYVYRAARDGR